MLTSCDYLDRYMNFFDILTLIALAWAVVTGWRSGLISQLLSLGGVILGIVLAIGYGAEVGAMLNIDERFSVVAGFLITFVAVLIGASILAKFLAKILSFIGLGWINTLLGVVLSLIKGIIVLGMLYAAIFSLNNSLQFIESQYFENSVSFDIVRETTQPLLKYWDEAKSAIMSNTPTPTK